MVAIEVHSKSHGVDGNVAGFVLERMSFAMDHFRHLRRIQVFIEDLNGPKGGPDKRCRIVADFGLVTVLVQETHVTWQAAVACALHRVARNAARRLQRMIRRVAPHQRRASIRLPRPSGPAPE